MESYQSSNFPKFQWNPTVDGSEIRWSPVEVGSLSHYLQSFIHPRCRISSINSINALPIPAPDTFMFFSQRLSHTANSYGICSVVQPYHPTNGISTLVAATFTSKKSCIKGLWKPIGFPYFWPKIRAGCFLGVNVALGGPLRLPSEMDDREHKPPNTNPGKWTAWFTWIVLPLSKGTVIWNKPS